MNSASDHTSQSIFKAGFNSSRLPGCCAGQALGCGVSFVVSWVIALILSALLAPVFGQSQGGNTFVGIILAALTFGCSLIIGGGLSFLTGRLFPIFKKKGG